MKIKLARHKCGGGEKISPRSSPYFSGGNAEMCLFRWGTGILFGEMQFRRGTCFVFKYSLEIECMTLLKLTCF